LRIAQKQCGLKKSSGRMNSKLVVTSFFALSGKCQCCNRSVRKPSHRNRRDRNGGGGTNRELPPTNHRQ
jgi:hypothetical protein